MLYKCVVSNNCRGLVLVELSLDVGLEDWYIIQLWNLWVISSTRHRYRNAMQLQNDAQSITNVEIIVPIFMYHFKTLLQYKKIIRIFETFFPWINMNIMILDYLIRFRVSNSYLIRFLVSNSCLRIIIIFSIIFFLFWCINIASVFQTKRYDLTLLSWQNIYYFLH